MRYIREDLAGDLGGQVQFDIMCGTSVGAIHACFFAATADMRRQAGAHAGRALGELRPRGDGQLRRQGVHARARDAARRRAHRGRRGRTPAGRRRADAAARTHRAPPDPLAAHRRQPARRSPRVAVRHRHRHRLGQDGRVRAERERPDPGVEQGPVRARAVGHDGRRARAGVGGAADPVPGDQRRRALLLRRRPAPEHAAVAGAAPGRRQGAGDRPAPQAARQRATSPRNRCRFRAPRSWSARSWTPSCSTTSTTTSIACAASTRSSRRCARPAAPTTPNASTRSSPRCAARPTGSSANT